MSIRTQSVGQITANLGGLERKFKIREPQAGSPSSDRDAKWLINYSFGFYDTDALAFFVRGLVRIPIVIVKGSS